MEKKIRETGKSGRQRVNTILDILHFERTLRLPSGVRLFGYVILNEGDDWKLLE